MEEAKVVQLGKFVEMDRESLLETCKIAFEHKLLDVDNARQVLGELATNAESICDEEFELLKPLYESFLEDRSKWNELVSVINYMQIDGAVVALYFLEYPKLVWSAKENVGASTSKEMKEIIERILSSRELLDWSFSVIMNPSNVLILESAISLLEGALSFSEITIQSALKQVHKRGGLEVLLNSVSTIVERTDVGTATIVNCCNLLINATLELDTSKSTLDYETHPNAKPFRDALIRIKSEIGHDCFMERFVLFTMKASEIQDGEPSPVCGLTGCENDAFSKCAHCDVHYCSRECQVKDWKEYHKQQCPGAKKQNRKKSAGKTKTKKDISSTVASGPKTACNIENHTQNSSCIA